MANNHTALVFEFYYDIVCPFAYIASRRIEEVAARAGAVIKWRPVLLGGIYQATEAPQGAQGSATDPMNPTKRSVFGAAFRRTLKRFKVPIDPPKEHPRKTVEALRLLHYLPDDARIVASHALFKAYWVDHVDVSNRNTLLRITKQALDKLPAGDENLTLALFNDESARRSLEKATADAVARGAPGVPGFWIPGESWRDSRGCKRQGRLYWGQDRLHFVEASLLRLRDDGMPSSTRETTIRDLIPRCRTLRVLEEPVKLEFWFDFSSPWAYLGWTRLALLQMTFGSQLHIELKPILLGALFKEIGAPQMPSTVISKHKRQQNLLDLFDWVNFWDAVDRQEGCSSGVGLRWPDTFPIRTPWLLRCAIVDPATVPALYEASWKLNRNIGDQNVLKTVLEEAGFDGEHLLEQAGSSSVREALHANTKAAKEAHMCGVPTFRVFRRGVGDSWVSSGAFVWGQDELAVVEDLISGWDETLHECAAVFGHQRAHGTHL